ncbi:MAG TPA: hypothetical protein VM686_10240 [Polyangiaceae bacterium]|nr:hypothetical protein [Polyangiaceae bacterium]
MAHYIPYDLIQAFAERPYDHENDLRRADVSRLVALTNEQLANLRGYVCPECSDRDCQACCERCGDRHGDMLEVKADRFRQVCLKCQAPTECASCEVSLPRYRLIKDDNYEGGGELFCEKCAGRSFLETW